MSAIICPSLFADKNEDTAPWAMARVQAHTCKISYKYMTLI